MRKDLGPTIKNLRPTKAQWHDGTRPTRPKMARDTQNLAQSMYSYTSLHF